MFEAHVDPLLVYEPLLKFFYGAHLPDAQRETVAPFGALARRLVAQDVDAHRGYDHPERAVAIRHLLDGMNAALRAAACLVFLLVGASASAQIVVNPATAKLEFGSDDHNTIIPPGQVGAGGPALVSYQAMVFPASADVSTGVPVWTSPVIPKTVVSTVGTATPATYSLTFFQMGITTATLGPCAVVAPNPCPGFTIVLVDIGAGGTTARSVASESDSFSWAALTLPALAAPPLRLKVKGS